MKENKQLQLRTIKNYQMDDIEIEKWHNPSSFGVCLGVM